MSNLHKAHVNWHQWLYKQFLWTYLLDLSLFQSVKPGHNDRTPFYMNGEGIHPRDASFRAHRLLFEIIVLYLKNVYLTPILN